MTLHSHYRRPELPGADCGLCGTHTFLSTAFECDGAHEPTDLCQPNSLAPGKRVHALYLCVECAKNYFKVTA